MLVIARKVGQTILIGDNIEITVSAVRGDQVRLAINAPREISVLRREVVEQVGKGNQAALESADTALLAELNRSLAPAPANPAEVRGKISLGRRATAPEPSPATDTKPTPAEEPAP